MFLKFSRRALRAALFVAGAALFVLALQAAGIGRLMQLAQGFGGAGAAVFLIYGLMVIPDAAAWRVLFAPAERSRVSFRKLYWLRHAGEAINNLTPFVDVGGEWLKVRLGAQSFQIPRRTMAAAAVTSRIALFFSEIAFWLTGLILAVAFLPLPPSWIAAGAATAAAAVIAGVWLYRRQKRGLLTGLAGAVSRFVPSAAWREKIASLARTIDAEIAEFRSPGDARFRRSVVLHYAGWMAGGIETWAMLRVIGADVSFPQALCIEAVMQLVRTASFMVPGSLGVQETGLAILVRSLGYDPTLGVALSLAKRARQLIWTGAGLAVWALWKHVESAWAAFRRSEIGSMDTFLDFIIHRPPARALARALSRTPVHPNHVTLLALVPAALSGLAASRGHAASALAALGLFYFWAVLDHADGELARLTGRTSAFGRRLDDICDNIASALILMGVFTGALSSARPPHAGLYLVLFYIGLALNASIGALVLSIKRQIRQEAAETGRRDPALLAAKRLLDQLTGREPFYLLMALAIPAFRFQAGSFGVLLALISGCYALSAGAFLAGHKMRYNRVS